MSSRSSLHTTHKSTFSTRFRKNLLLELKAIPSTLWALLVLARQLIWGFQVAILAFFIALIKGFDFPGHEQVAELMSLMIIPFIVVYFAGIYLTLLPLYLVIILALIPKKASYPLLGLSIFLSFFIVFLV